MDTETLPQNTYTAQSQSNPYITIVRDVQEAISPLSTGIVMAMIGFGFVVRWYIREPGNAIKRTIDSVESLQNSVIKTQDTLQKQTNALMSIGHNDILVQTKISNLEVRLDTLIGSIDKTSEETHGKIDKIHDDFKELFTELRREITGKT